MKKAVFSCSLVILLIFIGYKYELSHRAVRAPSANGMHDAFSFVQTEAGEIHYQLSGPENGPVVFLISGMNEPLKVWDFTVPQLAKAGYRVLRYDLYGVGLSQATTPSSGVSFFRRQLLDLISALQLKGPFYLVGHAKGASVAADFTQRYPTLVEKLVFIGPKSWDSGSTYLSQLLNIPALGRWLAQQSGEGSSLSKAANGLQSLSRLKLATMLLWGEEDNSSLQSGYTKAQAASLQNSDFHIIEKSAGAPQYESPAKVNHLLLSFFSN